MLRRDSIYKANIIRFRENKIRTELSNLAAQVYRESDNDDILLRQTLLMKKDNSRVRDSLEYKKTQGV